MAAIATMTTPVTMAAMTPSTFTTAMIVEPYGLIAISAFKAIISNWMNAVRTFGRNAATPSTIG